MAEMTFNKQLTALLVIDPHNDFIFEGGKIWMHAALDVNMPNYANAIVTADEIVDAISSPQRSGLGAQTVAIGHSQGDTRQRSCR